jgi:uncharacterized LabA/DUF88 family protein
MLGVDMALLAAKGKIHSVSLFTGDSDCIPAVEAVKQEGVVVTLWHGSTERENAPSRDLFRCCDERYDIATIISDCLQPEREGRPNNSNTRAARARNTA